ncbi:SHOCT domain-containing protein [Liquorilactobacillus nagelii]|uniref:SHOCT domain-containing protein n=1 Tax=Liquorilactobacillus nagelii TaxID=82688 RepID=UPI0039EBF01C
MSKNCSICENTIKALAFKCITADKNLICANCLKKVIAFDSATLFIGPDAVKWIRERTLDDIKKVLSSGRKINLSSVCPKCGSSNIRLISDNANVKKKKRTTSININPLHPLTAFNHNEKIVKKRSKAKTLAALATGGSSLLLTGGTKSNERFKIRCSDCGNEWNKNSIKGMNFAEEKSVSSNVKVTKRTELSIPDEILKYKKLADDGIITQEEFDAKKKQLLNL